MLPPQIIRFISQAPQQPQPQQFKRVNEDATAYEPSAKKTKTINDDDDDDDEYEIREASADDLAIPDSPEVAQELAKAKYYGTDIKESEIKTIEGIAMSTTSFDSTAAAHSRKRKKVEYELKVTNVVSKVFLLNKDKIAAARQEQSQSQQQQPAARGKKNKNKNKNTTPPLLNLEVLAEKVLNVSYTKRFPGAIVRMKEPVTATGTVFGSGVAICTGTRTEAENRRACKRLARIVHSATSVETELSGYTVVNMSATVTLPFRVRNGKLSVVLNTFYEPESFPAVIYRAPGVTLMIYTSGKINAVGARREEDIRVALDRIMPAIVKCKDVKK